MAYLNFAIDLTELPDGTYRVSVLSSPVGEASAVVDNPFSDDDIRAAATLLEPDNEPQSTLERTHAARQWGQRLFHFLIRQHHDINSAYFASLDRAGSDGLRLRLSLDNAGILRGLPWELLADPTRDFLALSRTTPVTRYTRQLSTRAPVPVILPLRVLVMISAPRDFPELNVEDEWNRLNDATVELQMLGLLRLERLETASLIALQRRLRAEDYHVFHYIGHSTFDPKSEIGVLALENEDDARAQLVPGAALARELSEETTIRLVVLNSCQSALADGDNPFSGIASSLVTRGIPAVVAMQHPISDSAAIIFAEEFYRALADTMPIDMALSEARRALANRLHNLEWATPSLFMRSVDGVLFTRTPTDQPRMSPLMLGGLIVVAALIVLVAAGLFTGAFRPTPPPTPALLADLEIVTVRNAPLNPAPGEVFRLLIGIRNTGDIDSGPFSWTWDASPVRLNALGGRIDSIPPGATYNLSFPFSYGWWGSFSSQIMLDVDAEVAESDERNNREPFVIETDPTRPLLVDFTLLPSNEIVETPLEIGGDAFALWNLRFGLEGAACSDAGFAIVNQRPRNLLTPSESGAAACADVPIAIESGFVVGRINVVVVATATGDAHIALYEDDSSEPVYVSPPVPVIAGQTVLLSTPPNLENGVRRAVVTVNGGPVQISTLSIFPLLNP